MADFNNHRQQGNLFLSLGEYGAACHSFTTALNDLDSKCYEINGDMARLMGRHELLCKRSLTHIRCNRPLMALSDAHAASKCAPDFSRAWFCKSKAQHALGNNIAAKAAWQVAKRLETFHGSSKSATDVAIDRTPNDISNNSDSCEGCDEIQIFQKLNETSDVYKNDEGNSFLNDDENFSFNDDENFSFNNDENSSFNHYPDVTSINNPTSSSNQNMSQKHEYVWATVKQGFVATQTWQLGLRPGERVLVLQRNSHWWEGITVTSYKKKKDGDCTSKNRGFFPGEFVTVELNDDSTLQSIEENLAKIQSFKALELQIASIHGKKRNFSIESKNENIDTIQRDFEDEILSECCAEKNKYDHLMNAYEKAEQKVAASAAALENARKILYNTKTKQSKALLKDAIIKKNEKMRILPPMPPKKNKYRETSLGFERSRNLPPNTTYIPPKTSSNDISPNSQVVDIVLRQSTSYPPPPPPPNNSMVNTGGRATANMIIDSVIQDDAEFSIKYKEMPQVHDAIQQDNVSNELSIVLRKKDNEYYSKDREYCSDTETNTSDEFFEYKGIDFESYSEKSESQSESYSESSQSESYDEDMAPENDNFMKFWKTNMKI